MTAIEQSGYIATHTTLHGGCDCPLSTDASHRPIELLRYAPHTEEMLEKAWAAGGPAEGDWTLGPFHDARHTADGSAVETVRCEVDFEAMTETNLKSGFVQPVHRQPRGEGATPPLSIIELHATMSAGERVYVLGKGLGKVIFVMEDNAKVEFDPPPNQPDATPRKTFTPLLTLFPATTDLDREDQIKNQKFDFQQMTPAILSNAVLGHHSVQLVPLTSDEAATVVSDQRYERWQYRPGTEWNSYSREVSDALFAASKGLIPPLTQGTLVLLETLRGPARSLPTNAPGLFLRLSHLHPDPPPEEEEPSAANGAPGAYPAPSALTPAMDEKRAKKEAEKAKKGAQKLEKKRLADEKTEAKKREKAEKAEKKKREKLAKAEANAAKQAQGKTPKNENGSRIPSLPFAAGELDPLGSSGSIAKEQVPMPANICLDELVVGASRNDAVCTLGSSGQICVPDDPQIEAVGQRLAAALHRKLGATFTVARAKACAGDIELQIGRTMLGLVEESGIEAEEDASHLAYTLELHPATTNQPVILSSPTAAGLAIACDTLIGSAASANRAVFNGGAAIMLPACYVADVPQSNGNYRRVAVGATFAFTTLGSFIKFAYRARAYYPSHRRAVRRAVQFSRDDDKKVVAHGRGLATLVAYDAETDEALLQLSPKLKANRHICSPEILRVPLLSVSRAPTAHPTGIDWRSAVFAEQAASGSGGVTFVELPGNRGVVVKKTGEPARELASYRIGQLLGIPMPPLTVCNTTFGEGEQISQGLSRLRMLGRLRRVSKAHGGGALRASVFVVVQQFQPGRSLKDICHHDSGPAWAIQCFGARGKLSESGQARLFTLGRIIALDVLVHNSDRWFLERIFENFSRCGNMGNIMFDDEYNPVAIDNATNSYATSTAASAESFDSYLRAVGELAETTRQRRLQQLGSDTLNGTCSEDVIEAHPAVNIVRQFFLHGQGNGTDAAYVPGLAYDIGEEGTCEVERGFLHVVDVLCRQKEQLYAQLREIENAVRSELSWMVPATDLFEVEMECVRADFFIAVVDALTTKDGLSNIT